MFKTAASPVEPSQLSTNYTELDLDAVPFHNHSDPLAPNHHQFAVTQAPCYFPTAEEFKDPYAYINKIRPDAIRYGLCKIVPPSDWNPPFALDTRVCISTCAL
jgi:histone demethylase JARID1